MTKAQGIGLVEVSQSLDCFAFLLVGESPVGKGLSIVGLKVEGLVVVFDGSVKLAFLSVNIAPVAEGRGEIGLQADGVTVVFDGPIQLAIEIIGIAPVVEDLGIVGIQADGLTVVGDGPVPLAFIFVGKAPVVEGDGKIRPDEPPGLNIPGTGDDSAVPRARSNTTSRPSSPNAGSAPNVALPWFSDHWTETGSPWQLAAWIIRKSFRRESIAVWKAKYRG